MNTTEIATKQDIEEVKELILNLSKSSAGEINPSRIMTGAEVKKYLGISEGTLKALRDAGELPASKILGQYLYEYKDVMLMIKRNKGRN